MNPKNMETSSFSLREEIEKVKALPKEQRADYLWTYYKLTAFLVLAGFILAWMVISFAVSAFMGTFFPEDPVSIALVSQSWEDPGLNQWVEDCKEAIGFREKEEELTLLTSTGPSQYNDSFNISCTLWLSAGQPDIFLCNRDALDYLLEQQVLLDLSELLPDTAPETYWLDITGYGFAQAAGVTEEPLYLCMYRNGSGLERATDIVDYILSE